MMRAKYIFILGFFTFWFSSYSQNTDNTSSELKNWIDFQFNTAIDSLKIPGATFVLVQGDSIVHCKGYGLADIEKNIAVSGSTTLFGIASISKTFVGVSIMKLYEQGKISLDEDVNTYLKSVQLDYKFDKPITIRNLLTHTGGFDESNLENRVRTEEEFIPLNEYVKKRIPPQIRPPGEVLSYSNFGYAILGLIVEDVSGVPFYEYLRLNILDPLDMHLSGFKRQEFHQNNYSKSYNLRGNKLVAYKDSFVLQYPAGSMTSTAKEMSYYMSMLLNYGTYKDKKLLDSLTVSKMFSSAFKHYDKAQNSWLWGFYEDHWNGFRIVKHEGDIDGFASTLALIPNQNIGIFISINASSLKNRTNRGFIQGFTEVLFQKMFPSFNGKELYTEAPQIGSVSKPLKAFEGTYRPTRYAQSTLEKVGLFIGLTPEINITTKDGRLFVEKLNESLLPISDLTFFAENKKKYVAFKEDKNGEISYFFRDTQSYHKVKWFESIRFQLILIAGIVIIFVIFIIGSLIRRFILKKKLQTLEELNFSISLLSLLFLSTFSLVLMKTDPYEFQYGLPVSAKISLLLPPIIIVLMIWSAFVLIKSIRKRNVGLWRLNYVMVIINILWIVWLNFWNLIGYNY
ncbi:serine hydrolase domain-containing protein [Winogradskyella alexanderae]|uniref:Beta-lactamase family protein n=1 Tax=Winogradskyella alexanderae TaxID=2877123 RepID=A0ABS7XV56_9FLAO|nr:serine hydrolase [Winogradskyella alexanderae]MCA0133900.1 beta-lactamase family protein [Winogradskyella alexanderae]